MRICVRRANINVLRCCECSFSLSFSAVLILPQATSKPISHTVASPCVFHCSSEPTRSFRRFLFILQSPHRVSEEKQRCFAISRPGNTERRVFTCLRAVGSVTVRFTPVCHSKRIDHLCCWHNNVLSVIPRWPCWPHVSSYTPLIKAKLRKSFTIRPKPSLKHWMCVWVMEAPQRLQRLYGIHVFSKGNKLTSKVLLTHNWLVRGIRKKTRSVFVGFSSSKP